MRKVAAGLATQRAAAGFTRHGIGGLEFTVDAKFKMQVRARAPACRAYIANQVALADFLPLAHGDLAHMGIESGAAIAMHHFDRIAIAILPACKFNGAVGYAHDGCATGRAVIYAFVLALTAPNGVLTHTKTRSHAGELQGRSQIGFA